VKFCGKVNEWHIWRETFLAKAKRYWSNNFLLGKLLIPKIDELFDEVTDQEKRMLKIINFNKIVFT
jgi:hypothetical protein